MFISGELRSGEVKTKFKDEDVTAKHFFGQVQEAKKEGDAKLMRPTWEERHLSARRLRLKRRA
jgi:hypothetical protein